MPNEFWLEIERLSNKNEARSNKELAAIYKAALDELKIRIGAFMAEHQDLSYVDMLQLNRMQTIYSQIDEILKNLTGEVRNVAYKADLKELEYGYFGEFYNIEKQLGAGISYGLMDERKIRKLIEFPVQGLPLSPRLYGEMLQASQKAVKGVLTEGLIQGYDNRKMARRLTDTMDVSYSKAKTIIRTESGRMNSLAREEAQQEAIDKGVNLQKRWIATLDRKTRHSHAYLDGQVIGKDEDFETLEGYRAKQPRMFGIPGEDINCRCGCVSVVNGFVSERRRDNESKQLIKTKNYAEWLETNHPDEYSKYQETVKKIIKNPTTAI